MDHAVDTHHELPCLHPWIIHQGSAEGATRILKLDACLLRQIAELIGGVVEDLFP